MKWNSLFSLLLLTAIVSCRPRCPEEPTPIDPAPVILTAVRLESILGSETKSGFVLEGSSGTAFLSYPEMFVGLWTHGGGFEKHRYMLNPDLASIPQNAIIDSAFITFYGTNNATSANITGGQTNNYGDNSFYIERITSSWDNVTWNTQPSTTPINRIAVADLGDGNEGSGKVSVLPLVKDIVSSPSTSFGILIKLQDETIADYRRVLFASNNHSDATLHPVLKVYYRK